MDGDLDQILLVLLGFFATLTLFLVLMDRLETTLDRPRQARDGFRSRVRGLLDRGSAAVGSTSLDEEDAHR